jgi:hypothetical protein
MFISPGVDSDCIFLTDLTFYYRRMSEHGVIGVLCVDEQGLTLTGKDGPFPSKTIIYPIWRYENNVNFFIGTGLLQM